MYSKLLLVTFSLILQVGIISGQRQWVLPTTTAAEMWNPYTWYWPYAIAAAEGYRDWYVNAQQITNQLYMQAYTTNAFGWNRPPQGTGGGATGQVQGAGGQAGGAAGQATNNNNPTGNQPVANMAQGGSGWNSQ